MEFKPTIYQLLNAIVALGVPMAFGIICGEGYQPTNRELGIIIGFIGVGVGQNYMRLVEILEKQK